MSRHLVHRSLAVPFLSAGLMFAIGVPAHAMPDSRSLTCQQAQALVTKSGRVVIATGPSIFGEVVANSGACRVSMAQRKIAPTRDNPRCNIGFVCAPRTGGR
jgi:hypothetical protein